MKIPSTTAHYISIPWRRLHQEFQREQKIVNEKYVVQSKLTVTGTKKKCACEMAIICRLFFSYTHVRFN